VSSNDETRCIWICFEVLMSSHLKRFSSESSLVLIRPAQNQTDFGLAGHNTTPLNIYEIEGIVELILRKPVFPEKFACADCLSFQVDAEHKDSLAPLDIENGTKHNISQSTTFLT
jgi:hypothetical protein